MNFKKLHCVLCLFALMRSAIARRPDFFGRKKLKKTSSKDRKHASKNVWYEKSFCRPIEITQEIDIKGCEMKTIKNKACLGKCSSFYLPGTMPPDDTDNAIKYMRRCNCCKPSLSTWTVVALHCPGRKSAQRVDKMVEIIYECQCSSCLSTNQNEE